MLKRVAIAERKPRPHRYAVIPDSAKTLRTLISGLRVEDIPTCRDLKYPGRRLRLGRSAPAPSRVLIKRSLEYLEARRVGRASRHFEVFAPP